jgi:SAM-dependent methyltransferase
MHPEFRNLANLVKHIAKSLLAGRAREAGAGAIVVCWRLREAVDEFGGSRDATCAFCGWSGRRFKTFLAGPYVRRGAVCPRCLSLERHREFIVLFRRLRPLFGGRIRILDIAPTRAFAEACRAAPDVDYVSVDKESELAMARMDVQRLAFREETFDVVVCYHVLDYVADDRGAMREIGRVLQPHGIGILQELVDQGRPTAEWTEPKYEELDRIRHYGYDFPDRLRDAGLGVRAGPAGIFLVFKDVESPLANAAEKAARS